jgi:multidrug resistance efflux pump
MNSSRIVLVNVIVILLLIVGGGAAVYYYTQSANYVSTNNARIDGQPISIAAPSTGKLVEWHGEIGRAFAANERIGVVHTPGGDVNINFPLAGTIVQQSAVINTFVAAGTPLARAYDLNNLWVTANIEETKINDIKYGQMVDVYVDAFPGTALTGTVSKLGLATAGTFSLLPAGNTTANYTKVTQVIPVTIALEGYRGLTLVPGMSVTVRIHK